MEKVPILLQDEGIIEEYNEIKDGQITKFKVKLAENYSFADIVRKMPDDWKIETLDDDTANIWRSGQPVVYTM